MQMFLHRKISEAAGRGSYTSSSCRIKPWPEASEDLEAPASFADTDV